MSWFYRRLKRYSVFALAGLILILLSAIPSSARGYVSALGFSSASIESSDFLDSASSRLNSLPVAPNLQAGYPIQTEPTRLQLRFDRSRGIINLSYSGVSLLDARRDRDSGFKINSYTLKKADGTSQTFSGDRDVSVSWTQPSRVNWVYPWGQITAQYVQVGNHLDISIDVVNTSQVETIERIEISPLTLRFPQRLVNRGGEFVWGIEGPPVAAASFGRGVVAIANTDPSRPLTVGYVSAANQQDTLYPLFVSTGLPRYGNEYLWPRIYRPIAPGASDHFGISLRFGASGSTGFDLAPDIYRDYAAIFPFQTKWDDRRPIGRLGPASHTRNLNFSTNPRGWLNDPAVNIFTQGGRRLLHDRMMAYADQSVNNLKAINAQGVILWDLEGEQYESISYVGDPSLVRSLAPEMDQIADEFFSKFRDAGLQIGVTLRPQVVRSRTDSSGQRSFHQEENVDVFQVLKDKIAYAKNRWGATLFYIDSNVGRSDYTLSSPSYDASVFQRLGEIYPDVLLIPEWQDAHYFAYTAPFDDITQPSYNIPSTTVRRELYPAAFQVFTLHDANLDAATYRQIVDRVRAGDILMADVWYWHKGLDTIRRAYQDAGL